MPCREGAWASRTSLLANLSVGVGRPTIRTCQPSFRTSSPSTGSMSTGGNKVYNRCNLTGICSSSERSTAFRGVTRLFGRASM
jgi:hypothetical protein